MKKETMIKIPKYRIFKLQLEYSSENRSNSVAMNIAVIRRTPYFNEKKEFWKYPRFWNVLSSVLARRYNGYMCRDSSFWSTELRHIKTFILDFGKYLNWDILSRSLIFTDDEIKEKYSNKINEKMLTNFKRKKKAFEEILA